MANWLKIMHKIVSIWVFDLAVWLPAIWYICIFVIWRWSISLSYSSMIYYATFHSYVVFNLLNTYLYNVNKSRLDEIINRNRQYNGNAKLHPIVLLYILVLFMGYFNVPWPIFWNQNDPGLRTFTFTLVVYLPSILTVLALGIVTPIIENPVDSSYWVLFWLYIYIHFAFIIHNYLTKFNLREYSLYYNPLAWIYIWILSPYFIYVALTTEDIHNISKVNDNRIIEDLNDTESAIDVEGGMTALDTIEHIEKQTPPISSLQDKILKSKTTLADDNPWSIWLEPLRKGDMQLQIEWQHTFHYKCIRDWVVKDNTWPEWRNAINFQF